MSWHTQLIAEGKWRVGRLHCTFEWRSGKSPMGRFGGGWQWKAGIQVGSRTVIISLLFCELRFDWKAK